MILLHHLPHKKSVILLHHLPHKIHLLEQQLQQVVPQLVKIIFTYSFISTQIIGRFATPALNKNETILKLMPSL